MDDGVVDGATDGVMLGQAEGCELMLGEFEGAADGATDGVKLSIVDGEDDGVMLGPSAISSHASRYKGAPE